MHPQTALSRVLLLLLFLHLSPLGSRSHPLGGPDPTLELSTVQELLDRLRSTVGEEEEQTILKASPHEGSSTEAWEARQAASTGSLGPHDNALQALQTLQSPKKMSNSGCFGRKLDRIGFYSGLGCNVQKKH